MRVIAALVLLVTAACGSGDSTTAPTTSLTTSAAVTTSSLPPRDHAAALPEARTEVAGALWDSKIAVVGGFTAAGAATARVDLYDPATDKWSRGPDLPVALHHAGVGVVGQRLYVVGGYSMQEGQWIARAEAVSLGPREDTWRGEPSMARARGALAVASLGDTLYAIGGADEGRPLRVVESLTDGADAWDAAPQLREAREHFAATTAGARVFAIAGRQGGLDTNLRTVESWGPGDRDWKAEPSLNEARGGIGAATVRGGPCVAGGERTSGTIETVECLIEGGWVVANRLAEARHGLAVVSAGVLLHVIGGGPKPGLTVSAAHEVLAIRI